MPYNVLVTEKLKEYMSHYDNTEHNSTAEKFIVGVDAKRPKHKKMSELEKSAAFFAFEKHNGLFRKSGLEPYIVHPAEVANILAQLTTDPHILAAAWLHDVVEDCGVTTNDLTLKFGPRVSRFVHEVTNPSQVVPEYKLLSRKERKEIDKAHIAKASTEAKMIKLADIFSNMHSLVANDPNFAKIWVAEKEALMTLFDEARFEPMTVETTGSLFQYNMNKLYVMVDYQIMTSKILLGS